MWRVKRLTERYGNKSASELNKPLKYATTSKHQRNHSSSSLTRSGEESGRPLKFERATAAKYRYPFYIEMLWFLIERYVHCFTGSTYLENSQLIWEFDTPSVTPSRTFEPSNFYLGRFEREGLLVALEFLSSLSEHKRHIPKEIIHLEALFLSLKVNFL